MTFSMIQKSQLEGALRLDAEYYQPEFLDMAKKLKNKRLKLLGDIADVIYGTTPTGGVFQGNGVPFIRSQNFSLLNISDNIVFCSENFHQRNKKSKVEPGNILFAAVGATIGQLAIIQNEIKEANINQNIAAIKIKDKNFNPYFVGLFFASHYGQFQIERLVTGNAQFYLNTEQIKNFTVPLFERKSQDKIAILFKSIQDKLENSKFLNHQAEELLLEELKLDSVKDRQCFTVKLSEVRGRARMDAEYFQPKYYELIKHIKNNCHGVKLGELASIKKGFEPGAEEYRKEGKLFIRVSSLSKFGVNMTEEKYLSEEMFSKLKDDFEPQAGEILLTKDASIGVAYVLKEKIQGIVSGGVLRLKLKNPSASSGQVVEDEYLALCLNSVVGQMQAERDAGGSVIAHWKPEQIKNAIIPILPKEIQKKITSLIRDSFTARAKAKELLEEAKRKVEEMIEK